MSSVRAHTCVDLSLTARSGASPQAPWRSASEADQDGGAGRFAERGLGLSASAAFPARLQKALKAKGIAVDIDQCRGVRRYRSGGRDRLDWSVPEGTEAVIVELGANDALRGIDPAVTRAALSEILTRLKARRIAVLLCGMLAPPNYGSEYAAQFNAIYPDLAKSFGVPLYPFFLDGVAADAKLNQADGMHPTAEGVDVIVEEYPAYGGGISRHDIRATQLKNRRDNPNPAFSRSFPVLNAACFAESHNYGKNDYR